MAGDWLASTANTNMFTYEIAPVFIMMEHEVNIKELLLKLVFFAPKSKKFGIDFNWKYT